MSDIRGEYWIINGQVDFADGDVGDQNHERIAIESICSNFSDQLIKLAESFELDVSNVEHYGELDTEALANLINEITEHLMQTGYRGKRLNEKQADLFIMKQIGANVEAFSILRGGGDARLYAMEHMDWIAVRSNNVEFYGYNDQKRQEIANGLEEILWEEHQEEFENINPEELEFALDDHKTGKSWYASLAELKQQITHPVINQPILTTYNQSKFSYKINPRDSEENKYAQPSKSKPNAWNAAARKKGIIGPGQELWRGTSENIKLQFLSWLQLIEQKLETENIFDKVTTKVKELFGNCTISPGGISCEFPNREVRFRFFPAGTMVQRNVVDVAFFQMRIPKNFKYSSREITTQVTSASLQKGSIEFFHKLIEFFKYLKNLDLGIIFVAEDRRLSLYSKILTRIGFEKVGRGYFLPEEFSTLTT